MLATPHRIAPVPGGRLGAIDARAAIGGHGHA